PSAARARHTAAPIPIRRLVPVTIAKRPCRPLVAMCFFIASCTISVPMHVYNNSTLSRSGLNFCNVTKRSLSYLLSLHQESRDRSFGIDFTFLAHFCTWTFFILNNLILFYLHLYVIMNR